MAVKKDTTEHCKTCGHKHVGKGGPCLKLGCGCYIKPVTKPEGKKK